MKRNNRFDQLRNLNPHTVFNIIVCWTLLIFTTGSFAATPVWQVNTSDYEFSMAFSSIVVIDGIETQSTEDILAAWEGTELRGVSKAFYVSAQDRYYFFPLVYSNTTGEEITFTYYEKARDTIIDLINVETFVADQNQGTFTEPYVFLNEFSAGELEHFDIIGIEETIIIDSANHKIQITLAENTDITQLVSEFLFSNGQSVTVDGVEQISGTTANDFSLPLEYVVNTSMGEIVWTVEVDQVLANLDQKQRVSFEVYPVPSSGIVNITSTENIDEILVTNMAGFSVYQNPAFILSLDLSHLPAGIYLLKVRSGSVWTSEKIVIE